uniref:Family with sequence similarity 81 member B n=1 Tax=Canis lupus familiaris TaxID=9615 RepID=A0A8C0N7X3_CANLF
VSILVKTQEILLLRGHSFLPVIPNTNRSHLEDRLNNQERTIAFLLEQAFRIKEDISACLQGTHGFRKEESLARKLLENHIQTITSIVKKLSQNIEILEDQIRARDQAATGTNFAVQELNTKHLQGVGDLRGRVARCDSSIVKLSGDIHFIRHEHRKIEKTIQDFMSALETVSKNLDMKVTEIIWNFLLVFCFFKILFIHERQRDTGRGRSRLPTGSQMRTSIPGPQDHALSQRQTLNH